MLIRWTALCSASTRNICRYNSTSPQSRVKKLYSDLPEVYFLPNGTPAEPLGEWSDSPPCDTTTNVIKPGLNATQVAELQVEHSRTRKRVRKAKTEKHDQLVTSQLPLSDLGRDVSATVKKPRQRRIPKNGGKPLPIKTVGLSADDLRAGRSSLASEILDNLKRFPHCLLLTRVGQFYESYFDQASEIAHLLNIKLTSRKWNGVQVPMCGFPLIHIDKHLKVLVQEHKRFVAMCEEFPRVTRGVKEFDRRVSRIITPGTLIDEPFLNPFENNYLLAISIPPNVNPDSDLNYPLGLAWMDVSTGEFYSRQCLLDSVQDELARIAPREVILGNDFKSIPSHPVVKALVEEGCFVSFVAFNDAPLRVEYNPPRDVRPMGQTSAEELLGSYLRANLLEHMPALSSPLHETALDRMQIDSHTIKALEIREGAYQGGSKGTLLGVIKRTTTSGGARLLARWLCAPSTSILEIESRQAMVASFHRHPHFRADIIEIISNAEDIGRIVQKFLLGRGDCSDLLSIARTVNIWSSLIKRVDEETHMEDVEMDEMTKKDWRSFETLVNQIINLNHLSERIQTALSTFFFSREGLAENMEGVAEVESTETVHSFGKYQGKWMINPDFSQKLTSLHQTLQSFLRLKDCLERELQLKYGAPSLTLRSSPALGMHVHISKAKRDQKQLQATPAFISISESGTTKSYFYKEWSQLGGLISETISSLASAEKEAFDILRCEVNSNAFALRKNAEILDQLDVALSFATLAAEMNFVRPRVTDDCTFHVINGRHPAVELGLLSAGRVYTPNSVEMTPTCNLHIITGPNMAGKSTFLRQTALIALLAQVGSFVPADSAIIGVVDKLFSRIGAKDDLFRDRSTFMVEMLETADILRRATPKSLVIMDEVGRGTTVKDGLALAFATVHHLTVNNQSRCLFATHFHELSDLLGWSGETFKQGTFRKVRFYCTDVVEIEDGHFAYAYRLQPGVNRESHGLKVAQLAGLPPDALSVATQTLNWLKRGEPESFSMPEIIHE